MTYIFEGEINLENTQKLTEFLSHMKNEKCKVYLESNGGQVVYSEIVRHELEQHGNIQLIAYGGIESAAFSLFKKFNGSKGMVRNTVGMCHMAYMGMEINENGKALTAADILKRKIMKRCKRDSDSFNNDFMTEKELKNYDKGKDVFFSPKRMEQIFNGVELI